MRYLHGLLSTVAVVTALVAVPTRVLGQAPAAQAPAQHDHEHQGTGDTKPATTPEQRQGMMMMKNMMADMHTTDEKLNALVQTMNAAKGAEKTEAMAALLTAIVKEHGTMHGSMMNMMNMMSNMPGMMGGMSGMKGTAPDKGKP